MLERANAHRDVIILDYKSEALHVLWRMRSMQISRRDMIYLPPDLDCSVSLADVAPWLTRLSEPPSNPATISEGSDKMQGAYCPFPERLDPDVPSAGCASTRCNSTGRLAVHMGDHRRGWHHPVE